MAMFDFLRSLWGMFADIMGRDEGIEMYGNHNLLYADSADMITNLALFLTCCIDFFSQPL